ncbi:CHRD domain-containing protein [Parasphingopyxis lamellibrachiae]|uniref:CHRD domain-containing protein n=1 Tax=Parasphingopyxis lamellibrachiae TaxID=680125 RepID=A0A3D9FGA9_9SPHN|nr:CHRD domain-containing protein [Parasphingopyxis lamellibrachiae]RED16829.1 CHRD domain-containing protein [Parasphingopyxis lamellibrachiae]
MKITPSILLGAIAAAGLSAPALAQESYSADLTGAAEVPGPGDPDGAGIATLDWDSEDEQLCYALSIDDIDPATAAHVHRGAAGEAGPPVITLDTPGADGGSDGCVEISSSLRRELRDNPGGFYVNVHNEPHPAGAVRGQLER